MIYKSNRSSGRLQNKDGDSEVITTAIVSALYFGGHQDHGRHMMKMTGMIPAMLIRAAFAGGFIS